MTNCEFAPIVLWSIYEELDSRISNSRALEERLSRIGADTTFLEDARDAYRLQAEAANEWGNSDFPLASDHSTFAAWLIAGLLRDEFSPKDFEIGITRTLATNIQELGVDESASGPQFRPVMVSWSLARDEADCGGQLIAVTPTTDIADDSVQLAYAGLNQHVLDLLKKQENSPLGEIDVSSILWRISGLLEALAGSTIDPRRKGSALAKAYDALSRAYRQYLDPPTPLRAWGGDWGKVAQWRNVLTHVIEIDGVNFGEAASICSEGHKEDINELLEQATRLVNATIAHDLYEAERPPSRPWESLKLDLFL